jgi:hypothetical protein
MTKSFTNLNSSAISSVEVIENQVKVVYNSNIDKEYTFNCENIDQFVEELSAELVDVELNNGKGSVGRFINQQIKDKVLVESK